MVEVAGNVLRRMAANRRPREADFTLSPAKAFRQALAKAAQDLMEMPLKVVEVTESRATLADLPDLLEDRALMIILDGPGEALGLLTLGPALLTGLIEMMTAGRFGTGAAEMRRPTRTDATMAAEFLDHALHGVEEALAAEPDIRWAGGFRYASWLEDPRPLGLLLEETNYRLFRLAVELGLGRERKGQMLIALPEVGRGPGPRRAVPKPGAEPLAAAASDAAAWSAGLAHSIEGGQVVLEVVLHRFTVPLCSAMDWQVGTLLTLPGEAVDKLEVLGSDGRVVAGGRLGQAMGFRALRLAFGDQAAGEEVGDSLAGHSPFPAAMADGAEADGGAGAFGAMVPLGGFGQMDDLPPLGGDAGRTGFAPMAGLPLLGGEDGDDGGAMPPMAMAMGL